MADEFPALVYGANCPQNAAPVDRIEQSFIQDWDDGWMSEDMLKLNIWTPCLSGKRAVMVYFHGGGYSFGSSYELPSHEGAQMARHHDVVQVSVNHRLNILGFLDAAEIGGSAYEDSANVGMTDLVAAALGPREHCQLRRRSRSRHDLWPIRRRFEGDDADGHAVGGGSDSSAAVNRVAAETFRAESSSGARTADDEGTRACAE